MIFIHDTRMALNATVDLVNTLPRRGPDGDDAADSLATLDDFANYLVDHPYTGVLSRDLAEFEAVRAIRGRLRELWRVDRVRAVPLVNEMLRDGEALPQLVIHDGYDWHIHAADHQPLATRILVEAAMAFVDVIRADEYDRVRSCDADDCDAVFIDYSRNRSKRYCDTGNCGNRMNVHAYRRRKAEDGD